MTPAQQTHILKTFTANPKTGRLSYKLNEDIEAFADAWDTNNRKYQMIGNQKYYADTVAFLLYHGRQPDSSLAKVNGIEADIRQCNLVETSAIIAASPYLGYRSLSVQLLKDAFGYDPDTGTLTFKALPSRYFPDEATQRRRNARVAGKQAFTTIDNNGYMTCELFGMNLKAHIVAYAIVNDVMPSGKLTFKDYDRSNIRYENITQR